MIDYLIFCGILTAMFFLAAGLHWVCVTYFPKFWDIAVKVMESIFAILLLLPVFLLGFIAIDLFMRATEAGWHFHDVIILEPRNKNLYISYTVIAILSSIGTMLCVWPCLRAFIKFLTDIWQSKTDPGWG